MPPPISEAQRLAELRDLDLLSAPPAPVLAQLAALAAHVCEAPQALISLIDDKRQWYKATHGFQGESTPRNESLCERLLDGEPELVIADLHQDPAWRSHPALRTVPSLRFYAGMALALPSGARIGSLCVFGPSPHTLQATQRERLRLTAGTAVQSLLLQSAQRRGHARLQGREQQFRALSELAPCGIFHTDASGACTYTNPAWQHLHGLSQTDSLGLGWLRAVHPDDSAAVLAEWNRTTASGEPFRMEFRVRRGDGSVRELVVRTNPQRDANGRVRGQVGVVEDITERRLHEEELRLREMQLEAAARLTGVGAWRVDLGPTPTVHWNDQTARLHDLPAGHQPTLDEAIGYYAPAARSAMEKAFARTAEGGPGFDVVLPLTTARSRAVWVRAVGESWPKDGPPRRVLGAFMDISATREREAQLSASNARLRQLYEQSPALLANVDAEGQLLAASNALLRQLAMERHQLPSRHWLRAADAQRLRDQWLPRLRTDGRLDRVPCQLRTGGEMLFSAVLDAAGEGLATAVLEDVSATLQAGRELQREQELRERLQSALNERSDMLDVLAHEVRQPLHNAAVALEAAQSAALPESAHHAVGRAQSVLARVRAGIDNTLVSSQLLAREGPVKRQTLELGLLLQIVAADIPDAERQRVRGLDTPPARTLRVDAGLTRLALRNVLLNALAYSQGPVQLAFTEQESPPALCVDVSDQGPGFDAAVLPHLFERSARGGGRAGHGLGLHLAHKALRLQGGDLQLLRTGPQGSTLCLVLADD